MIFGYLNPFVFIMSFGVGLLIVYMIQPAPTIVIKFPTPLNAGKVIYREDDTCFKYSAEEVSCDDYTADKKKPLPTTPPSTIGGLPKSTLAGANTM